MLQQALGGKEKARGPTDLFLKSLSQSPDQTKDEPTILSKMAYLGPTKEDLALLNKRPDSGHQQHELAIEDVIQVFRELEKTWPYRRC